MKTWLRNQLDAEANGEGYHQLWESAYRSDRDWSASFGWSLTLTKWALGIEFETDPGIGAWLGVSCGPFYVGAHRVRFKR